VALSLYKGGCPLNGSSPATLVAENDARFACAVLTADVDLLDVDVPVRVNISVTICEYLLYFCIFCCVCVCVCFKL
jgi:hypothetical protein